MKQGMFQLIHKVKIGKKRRKVFKFEKLIMILLEDLDGNAYFSLRC